MPAAMGGQAIDQSEVVVVNQPPIHDDEKDLGNESHMSFVIDL